MPPLTTIFLNNFSKRISVINVLTDQLCLVSIALVIVRNKKNEMLNYFGCKNGSCYFNTI